MANKIVQISKRAKAIRKAKPNIAWQTAIKQASKELKGKSTPRKVKRAAAKKKTVVTKKAVYRKTVSVGSRKTGSVGSHGVTAQLSAEISRKNAAERELMSMPSTRGMNAMQKRLQTRRKNYLRKTIAAHKKIITQLKGLI